MKKSSWKKSSLSYSRWEPEPVQSNLPGRHFDQSYSWNFRSKSKQVLSNFVPLYYYSMTWKALQAKELTNSAIQVIEYHENWKYDIQNQGTAGIYFNNVNTLRCKAFYARNTQKFVQCINKLYWHLIFGWVITLKIYCLIFLQYLSVTLTVPGGRK